MSEKNKALIRRWFEQVWNKDRADAIAEMLVEDAVVDGLSDDAAKPLRGTGRLSAFSRAVSRSLSEHRGRRRGCDFRRRQSRCALRGQG